MTLADSSKLEAVNTMLSLIGQRAVNTLTGNTVAEASMASRILDEVSRHTQTLGWVWNQDKVTITATAEGKFSWEENWLAFDVDRSLYPLLNVVRRNGFVWNAEESTDVFTESTLDGVATVFVQFEDLPEVARQYVMICAARRFLNRTMGGEERAGYAQFDERRAWSALTNHESEQSDANILDYNYAMLSRRRYGSGLLDGGW